jgi:hypothetical protein
VSRRPGPNEGQVSEGRGTLHNEGLHDLSCSLHSVGAMKSRRLERKRVERRRRKHKLHVRVWSENVRQY